jgi:hypothetical protein
VLQVLFIANLLAVDSRRDEIFGFRHAGFDLYFQAALPKIDSTMPPRISCNATQKGWALPPNL